MKLRPESTPLPSHTKVYDWMNGACLMPACLNPACLPARRHRRPMLAVLPPHVCEPTLCCFGFTGTPSITYRSRCCAARCSARHWEATAASRPALFSSITRPNCRSRRCPNHCAQRKMRPGGLMSACCSFAGRRAAAFSQTPWPVVAAAFHKPLSGLVAGPVALWPWRDDRS